MMMRLFQFILAAGLAAASELVVSDDCVPMSSFSKLTFEEGRKIKKVRKEQDDLQLMCDGESCRYGVLDTIVCQQVVAGRFSCDGEEVSRGRILQLATYEISCDSCNVPREGYIRNDSCILRYSLNTKLIEQCN
eukprot:TRINITY_DN20700_c0_g1_i1.p1 TRINITY_DN20700_c0_g1~~TRINITY_DN20700_c0_g1_i1.p1  ORF type:complete len:134 (+),score=21.71 TRINITY_DN20700_c0_g1_i1:44-445(+)